MVREALWGEPPPPQLANATRLMASRSVADTWRTVWLRVKRQASPNKSATQTQTKRVIVGGKCVSTSAEAVVIDAEVPTVTVTEEVPVPLSCTEEFDRLHVGGAGPCGVMAQERATAPANELNGVKFKVNVAF